MKGKKNQGQPQKKKKLVKSMRGVPEYYDECKKTYCISLTPTAHAVLKDLASDRQLSLSELLEQIGRKIFILK